MRRTLPAIVLVTWAVAAAGQETALPPPDRKPALRLDPGGPTAPVTALAFAPDGKSLFAAGLDKTVRVYRHRDGTWVADAPLRVPVGRENAGAVNALAVSADGRWLAAAGRAPMAMEAYGAFAGVVVAAERLPEPMLRDLGVIYLFDLTDPAGGRVLRGHKGAVLGLAFAAGAAPVLVSAAVEPVGDGQPAGVVRAWDVQAGTELASRGGFPPTPTRVGLGGWPTGAGEKDLTVAVAWPEPGAAAGRLRLWAVARGEVDAEPDGSFNRALAVLRGADGKPARVVSGGFANLGVAGAAQHGQVVVRPLTGGAGRPVPLPPSGGRHYLPLAAAPAGEAVALLLERSGPPAETRPTELALLDPGGGLLAARDLAGVDAGYLPVLAATKEGETVAIAGFRDHRVEVYAVADLRRNAAEPKTLPGGPPGFARVRFLDGGSALGLTPEAGGEVVFDFAKRSAGPGGAGRKPDAPTDVQPEFVEPAKPGQVYEVRVPGVRPIRFDPGVKVTSAAFLPGRPAWLPGLGPVVAVGHVEPEKANPLVTLYDGETGRPIRQLSGHLQPARGLAFSAARPLLASAAGDGTVCVYSLKDLDRQAGAIDGLVVADRGGAVTVTAAGGAVAGLLAVGEVIEAAGGGEKPHRVKTVVDFLWQAGAATPGGTLPVRVRGKAEPVALPVARGFEERKPLFTLWVGPADRGGVREWVGWSPAGPYDVSGPAAEAKIGWLTGTGDPKAPTTFAGADEYRGQYFKADLLRFLAEKGELAAALDARDDAFAPPPPRLALKVPQADGRLLRFGKATLRVDLDNLADDFPLAAAELRYRVRPPGGDAPGWMTAPASGARPWSFDLSGTPWKRGEYTIEVELLRRKGGPAAAREAVSFVAVPPRPTLSVTAAGTAIDAATPADKRAVAVKEPKLRLAVKAAGHGGEPLVVTVADGGPERKLAAAAGGSFPPVELPLKPGDATVRVSAVPAGATADTRDAEAAELAVAVRYDPPMKEPTPAIEPIGFAPAGERMKLGEKEVIAVAARKVEASAKITAGHPLAKVHVAVGGGKAEPLDAAGGKAFTARRELALEPGVPVRVAVSAATANSDPGERAADVAYLPFPPDVTVAPLAAAVVTDPKLTVSGTFAPPADAVPFTIHVVVSQAGRDPVRVAAKTDPAARTWSAGVTLFPGSNQLTVVVENAWRKRVLDVGTVAYRRPPRIVPPVKPADAGTKAVADVVLTVETAEGLDPKEVLIGGRVVPAEPPKKLAAKGGVVTWEVTARGVPVKTDAGWAESLSAVVRNDDGDSVPAAVPVKRQDPPKIAPPRITLRERDATTDAESAAVKFRVTSAEPLHRVEVRRRAGSAGEYELVKAFAGTEATKAGGLFVLDAEVAVPLAEGANLIRVEAVNDGGGDRAETTIGRTPPPVQVVVEGLDEVTRDGAVVKALPTIEEGRFAKAATGFVSVRGYVRWARPDNPEAADPALALAVSVNRTDHLPVPLEPAKDGKRRFRAPLFLNAEENTVRLEVRAGGRDRAVPQQRAGSVFRVGCREPVKRQRLHVVVVGVDVPEDDRTALVGRMVAALGGKAQKGFEAGGFEVPGFVQATLYPPLLKDVLSGDVRWALTDVADRIKSLAAAPPDDWVNDVVLVYYQGKDWVDPHGRRWLHTSRSLKFPEADWTKYAVDAGELPESAGVRLLLLSVEQGGAGTAAAGDGKVQMVRYAWADPAARPQMLSLFGQALAARVTVGDVVQVMAGEFLRAEARAGEPVEHVAEEVRGRRLGRGGDQ
jgi:WD40 repeat protein